MNNHSRHHPHPQQDIQRVITLAANKVSLATVLGALR
jgi:hypothetical protein